MYDRFFNVLAFLTFLGVVFIGCTAPSLLTPAEDEETPQCANMGAIRGIKTSADGITLPDVSRAFEVKAAKESAKAIIDDVLTFKDVLDSIEVNYYRKTYAGEFYLTKYAATVEQCGNDLGITASGKKVTTNPVCWTVAVDPKVIPLGTFLMIDLPGYEGVIFEATDTGSAIKGNDIDIYTDSVSESKTFNPTTASVYIIEF